MADNNLEAERQAARLAMEGAEWTAKREAETKAKAKQGEQATLQAKLAEIGKQKEVLELGWVDLDNNRKAIRTVLNPLLDEEKKVETEEMNLEAEEAKIGLSADKHAVEEKRWAIQGRRKVIEEQRWQEEQKLAKVEKVIEANTAQYRKLLDEEDGLHARLEQLRRSDDMSEVGAPTEASGLKTHGDQ